MAFVVVVAWIIALILFLVLHNQRQRVASNAAAAAKHSSPRSPGFPGRRAEVIYVETTARCGS